MTVRHAIEDRRGNVVVRLVPDLDELPRAQRARAKEIAAEAVALTCEVLGLDPDDQDDIEHAHAIITTLFILQEHDEQVYQRVAQERGVLAL